MSVIIPDYISDEIDAKLDTAIADTPEAAPDRAFLRSQLVGAFDKYGCVPDFSLKPNLPEMRLVAADF